MLGEIYLYHLFLFCFGLFKKNKWSLRKLRCVDAGVGERGVKKLSRGEKMRQIVSAYKQVWNLSIRLQLDEVTSAMDRKC